MATTFCGSVALSAAFPGFMAVLTPLRGALSSLRVAVQAALAAVAEARAKVEAAVDLAVQLEADLGSAVDAHLEALASAKLAIRLKALADLEVQLQAAIGLETSFSASLSDPSAYISGLISAVGSVQVNLTALVPQASVALNAQLAAALALKVSLEAKIATFDLVLSVLVDLSAALQLAVDAVLAVSAELRAVLQLAIDALVALSAALQAAFDLTTAPLSLALDLEADLSLASVEVYRYDGTVADLAPTGFELGDAIAADSLLPGGTVVRAWLLMAPASATDLVTRLTNLLKSTP